MSDRLPLGFHCSHEQHPPSALLRLARLAEDAGFTAAMCSDHFHPWSERQGQSGSAWTWLGAAMQATRLTFGTVCAPGQRYHPAIVAQGAATLAEMFPDRFWIAVGSGEALNESITGGAWPDKAQRHVRVRESVEIMRALWAGESVSRQGHVSIADARLYSRPASPPPVIAAALTPETARWAGGWADGLITVAGPRDAMCAVRDAFRETAGSAKPIFLQVALAFAPTDAEAAAAAHDQWRQCTLDTALLADLRSPEAFDRAVAGATVADVAARIRVSSDIARHEAWLRDDATLGFERIYLHNVVREHQERFLDACASRLLEGRP